jgi:hypothetical protein
MDRVRKLNISERPINVVGILQKLSNPQTCMSLVFIRFTRFVLMKAALLWTVLNIVASGLDIATKTSQLLNAINRHLANAPNTELTTQ